MFPLKFGIKLEQARLIAHQGQRWCKLALCPIFQYSNILKLEIAVHDSLFVDVLERSEQIEQEDRDVLVGDGVSLFL